MPWLEFEYKVTIFSFRVKFLQHVYSNRGGSNKICTILSIRQITEKPSTGFSLSTLKRLRRSIQEIRECTVIN